MIPESVLVRLKQGDKAVLDSAIEACLPRAEQIASAWGRRHPNQVDDIKGAAALGTVRAIHSIASGNLQTENVKAYVDQTIREHIRDFIRNDHLVYIPKDAFRGQRERNEPIPILYCIDRREDDEENIEEEEGLTFDVEVSNDNDNLIIEEFYDKLTNFEKIVLSMREESKTLMEIAAATGKSVPWIHKVLGVVKDKFIRERIKHGRESNAGETSDTE